MSLPRNDIRTLPSATAGPALDRLLYIVDTALAGTRAGLMAVPSAGAIYPYECFLIAAHGTDSATLFALDLPRPTCRAVLSGGELLAAVRATGIETNLAVLVLSRPWLSMRKYGDRGYLYTQLDTAHAVGNIALATEAHDGAAEIRHRPVSSGLRATLGPLADCREIHSVVAVDVHGVLPATHGWQVLDARSVASPAPHWQERANWHSLGEDVADRSDGPRSMTLSPALGPVLPQPPRFSLDLFGARRSASAFVEATVAAQTVAEVFRHTAVPLAGDIPADTGITATAVLRDVSPGSTGEVVDARRIAIDGDDVTTACMGQHHLRAASVVVLVHAPRSSLTTGLGTVLMRAGIFGQLLYLGATAAGLGVTGVGGFDSTSWRQFAGLPADHDVVYVLALGVAADDGEKADRDPVPYAGQVNADAR